MNPEFGKDQIKLSFSTYDFLGYFIPGIIFFTIIVIFELKISTLFDVNLYTPIYKFYSEYIFDKSVTTINWVESLLIFIILISTFYVFGHIIASISAFIIDRNLIGKCSRYPYIVFLNIVNNDNTSNDFKYKFLTLLVVTNLSFIITLFLACKCNLFILLFLPLILYCLLTKTFLFKKVSKCYEDIIINIKKFLHMGENFPKTFCDDLMGIYQKFKIKPQEARTYTYWFTINYVIEYGAPFRNLIFNWFNLYSFSRNLSTAVYLSFCYIIFYINFYSFASNSFLQQFYNFSLKVILFKIFILIIFVIAFLLLLRFYYLYFNYFNKYVFRTFYYLIKTRGIKKIS